MCYLCYPRLLHTHCDQLDWVFPLLVLSVDIHTTWSPQRVSRTSYLACRAMCQLRWRLSLYRLGPMLMGFVLDTILYGVVVTQSLVYFSCYKR